ncbi:MAG TPA: TonB-dependent siderophore receptor [Burkholderiaceae bacterium]|nr:TonB-dependent siderophore receptor [Burkholderiaceae bacterium]
MIRLILRVFAFVALTQACVVCAQAQESPSLAPVVVTATSPSTDYNVPNAVSATKTDTPIRDTPFAVQVVSEQTIRDQQATRIQDAILGNVSSVAANANGLSDNTNFTIRGFNTGPNVYQDGLLMPYSMNVDTANIRVIEVLKGPAAALYGRMPPGGLVNYATKQPQDTPYYALQETVGSFGTTRTEVDLTSAIDERKTLQYRLDADYTRANSFVDFENSRNVFFAPSISYRPTDRFDVTIQGEYQHVSNVDSDPNFPAVGNRPAAIPISTYLEDPGVTVPNPDTMTKKFVAYHWTYRLGGDWQIVNRLAYNDLPEHVTNMYFASVSSTGDGINSLQYGPAGVQTLSTNLELTGSVRTGGIDNRLLFGVDRLRFSEFFNGTYDYAAQSINVFNAQAAYDTVDLASALDPNINGFALLSKQSWTGVYAQDMIAGFGDRMHLLVGGRYDHSVTGSGIGFGSTAWAQTTGGFVQASDSGFSPRIGLNVHVLPWASVYANYSRSLSLSNVAAGVTVTGQPLSPQWSVQKEIGWKSEFLDKGLAASFAYFDITQNDIPAAVPNTTGVFYLIGQARSRGFEFDLTGRLNANWSVIATLSHDVAKVTQGYTSNFVNVSAGSYLPAVPVNMATAWVRYTGTSSLPGWRLALGVSAVSQAQGDPVNDMQIPGYAVCRGMVGYDFTLKGKKLTAQLNVDNALNQRYFYGSTAYGNAYSLTPGTPRSVMASLRAEL